MILVLSSFDCTSQNEVVLLNYKVFYDFKKALSRDVYMILNNEKSLYIEKSSSTRFYENDKDFEINHAKEEDLKIDSNNFVFHANYKYEDDFIIQNLVTNKLFETIQKPYFGNFISEESLPRIEWILLNEFKTVKNVNCQKAIGNFRGLQWEIWFSPKYPIPFGPWKLFGAPGLIFEASTIDMKVTYLLQGIKSDNMKIDDSLPKYKQMTLKDLVEFMDGNSDIINEAGRNSESRTKVTGYRNPLEPKYEWEE